MAVPPRLHSSVIDANLHQQFLPIFYCGVIVIGLAVLALVTSFRRRAVQLALGTIVLIALLAAGKYFLPVAWVWGHLSGKGLRHPAPLLGLPAIPLALLVPPGGAGGAPPGPLP